MSSYIQGAQKAEALKKELDALLPMKKEDEDRLWQKFRLEWNYNSNHIEGNTLSYSETKLLIIFGKTSGTHEIRDFDEMRAHDTAVKLVREWALDKDRNLTESDIRTLNEIILVRPFWKEAITPDGQQTRRLISIGKYKEEPNSVLLKNGEIFPFASPAETPAKMEDLMKEYYKDIDHLHPFQLAAEFHYKFVRIHPFDDGNGRVARLIMNYILLKGGYPPVIIKSDKKEQYYDALQKADSGDRAAFMEYITDQLSWSLDLTIKAAKGNEIDEFGDTDKKIQLFKEKVKNHQFLKVKKGVDVCLELISSVIVPFFEKMLDRFKVIDDLFIEHTNYMRVNFLGDSFLHTAKQYIDIKLPKSVDKLNLRNSENTKSFESINFVLKWDGYKHSESLGSIELQLNISFDDYFYLVNIYKKALDINEIRLKKSYHEQILESEEDLIIEELMKIALNKLEKLSGPY